MSAAGATQTRFLVDIPAGGAVVDIAAILSRHNQRLYRQGRVYGVTVSSIPTMAGYVYTSPATQISAASNNWLVRKAWGLAFKKWRESTQEERSNGVKAGRWNDFRVALQVGDNTANYVTADRVAAPLADGELVYTTANSDSGGATRTYGLLGNTSGTVWSILEEYDRLMDTDQDTPPANSGTMPYSDMMQALNDGQANAIQEEGDDPPYNATNARSNCARPQYFVGNPDTVNRSSGLILAPCGLIDIDNTGAETRQYVIDVKSGKYKGVHAEAMI